MTYSVRFILFLIATEPRIHRENDPTLNTKMSHALAHREGWCAKTENLWDIYAGDVVMVTANPDQEMSKYSHCMRFQGSIFVVVVRYRTNEYIEH